ncbi:MAG TPA: YraN family protein [Gammaproteobacteria bacterium]|nr:YraN family protein [Gammaproteobacteria bacterium]
MVAPKKALGDIAEQRALAFLQARGLTLITRNYRVMCGEIDLIMRDEKEIVFVEVRSRAPNHYGDAIDSINRNKQKKILRTALFFLQQKKWLDKINCRFDVIGVHVDHIEWIKDAFTADIL